MRRSWLYLLVFLPLFSVAQVTITGTVINMADTKPIAAASVFLSNTTTGNQTTADGTFTLYNVKPGKYDLIVSILGYENYIQSIIVDYKDIHFPPISLISKIILLKAVKIKPDNAWYRLYEKFKEEFLGTSAYAKDCKILNPDSLDLNYDNHTRQLTASSRGFLIIENKALGYRLKTKVVYCQDYRRPKKKDYGKKFDFLGFTFKPKTLLSNRGGLFLGYGCAISQKSQTRIVEGWKQLNLHRRSDLTIQEIAEQVNPQMLGVIGYYGKFKLMELRRLMRHFELRLVKWVLNKYKKFRGSYSAAYRWIKYLKRTYPTMFYYWTVFKYV